MGEEEEKNQKDQKLLHHTIKCICLCYASIRKSKVSVTSARKPISLILFMEQDANVGTLTSLHFSKETNCRQFWLRSKARFRNLLGAKTPVRHIHHQPLKAKAKLLTALSVRTEDLHASLRVSPLPDTLAWLDKYSGIYILVFHCRSFIQLKQTTSLTVWWQHHWKTWHHQLHVHVVIRRMEAEEEGLISCVHYSACYWGSTAHNRSCNYYNYRI